MCVGVESGWGEGGEPSCGPAVSLSTTEAERGCQGPGVNILWAN